MPENANLSLRTKNRIFSIEHEKLFLRDAYKFNSYQVRHFFIISEKNINDITLKIYKI